MPDLDALLADALAARASDLHLEPTAKGCQPRRRVDGLLEDLPPCDAAEGRRLAHQLMARAGLLTYRPDVPQEGTTAWTAPAPGSAPASGSNPTDSSGGGGGGGGGLELRVAVMPTAHGPRVVVRLPAELTRPRGLGELGLPAEARAGLEAFAAADAGLLVLAGPAGSGKTTTTYALLEHLVATRPGESVVTLEDPIERDLPGVTQVEISPFGELTFELALRSLLRQDPQVLAVGEVRDAATAGVALRAALSGHRLVCTLHAEDPAGAVARLIDLGADPGQLSGALFGVLALRLVRRGSAAGGYAGRAPAAAFLRRDPAIVDAVLGRGASAGRPAREAVAHAAAEQPGARTPRDAGRALAAAGVTDEAELLRVFGSR